MRFSGGEKISKPGVVATKRRAVVRPVRSGYVVLLCNVVNLGTTTINKRKPMRA